MIDLSGDGLTSHAAYAVHLRSTDTDRVFGEGAPAFTITAADDAQVQRILEADSYSTAVGFVNGAFDVEGDLIAALSVKAAHIHPHLLDRIWAAAACLAPGRIETWVQSRKRAAENIKFHYDISNDFYAAFLDSRRVYSAGCFEDPTWSLEHAQEEKLDRICQDLQLTPGERFLDVGCGWGALLIHAAEQYGVSATGCTLSHAQYEFATSSVQTLRLDDRISVREIDYRAITSRFDKIASVGMFEHVGRRRLGNYFRRIYGLLEEGGLFYNSGVCRPQAIDSDPETWFLLKKVFPGGELAHVSEVVCAAEQSGFSILEVHSFREDYARTCREWVDRLRQNREKCIRLVGEQTYRTWLLYLAASAFNFETCRTEAFSILMKKQRHEGTIGNQPQVK